MLFVSFVKKHPHRMVWETWASLYIVFEESFMTLRRPSRRDILAISELTHIDLTDKEVDVLESMIADNLELYDELDQFSDAIQYTTPAIRIPGNRPTPEQDPHNGIVRTCDVRSASPVQGLLSGKRIGVKDTVCVAGIPTTCGSRLLYDYVPDVDAPVVSRIIEAGGHITAMLNTDDFSCAGAGHTSTYGAGLNPRNEGHLAGGSSCGSAIAIVNNQVDISLGGDQGGSIRIPAAWSGIVGLKPTHGLVPYTGIAGFDPMIDHIGPMAKTVEDVALMLSVIAGKDTAWGDPRQPDNIEKIDYVDALTGSLAGLRIAVVEEGFNTPWSMPEVNEAVREAIKLLEHLGATVRSISVPEHTQVLPIWNSIANEGGIDTFNHGLNPYGTKAWYNTRQMSAMSKASKTNGGDFSPTAKLSIVVAHYMKEQYHGVFYGRAKNMARRLTAIYDAVLSNFDLVVMPTTPQTAHALLPAAEVDRATYITKALNMVSNTAAFDLTGHPSISVPCKDVSGLPVGLMFTGRSFDEATVLRAAHAYQNAV
jgi:amidase